MKIKNIILALSLLFFYSSCEDQMNYNEFSSYDEEDIFESLDRTRGFVTNIYGYIWHGYTTYGNAMLASACDEAEYAWTYSSIQNFYNGSWSPTSSISGLLWENHYAAIRAANYYLEASQGRTFDDFKYNDDYLEQMSRFERYQYEVRFLRAYFYFELVRQYGDVPFITEVLTLDEANEQSRTPKETIFDFIVSECDAVADHLPVSYTNSQESFYTETGRVNRATVLALKARTLLYRASPLFNESNEATRWRDAARASKAVLDFCDENGISLGLYSSLWGTNNYNAGEVFFTRRIGDTSDPEWLNFPVGVENGQSGNCPTQTLVDAYEMQATGKYWNEEGSGYDPANPYEGRDPRFELTIAKNGDLGWPGYNSNELQTYYGGLNGRPISGATPTGYYLKKQLDATVDLRPNSAAAKRHSWVLFRLGEFYLNYAEAVFHYLGSADATDSEFTLSAREAVNRIRSRSDMPSLPAGMSNDAFEKKYKNERMVELAFEDHRFWDVRRWKDGEVLKTITVMEITKNANETYSYNRVTRTRLWQDKMYFFPIPATEILKNPNLTQNSGW